MTDRSSTIDSYRVEPTRDPAPARTPLSAFPAVMQLHRAWVILMGAAGLVAIVHAIVLRFRLDAHPRLWDCYIALDGNPALCEPLSEADKTALTSLYDALGRHSAWAVILAFALALVIGTAAGALLLSRELETRSHTFILTQGISHGAWWRAKVVVVGVPLILVSLAVGLVTEWSIQPVLDVNYWHDGSPVEMPQFLAVNIMPALVALASFSVSLFIGTIARRSVTAVIVSAALVGASTGLLASTYVFLVPPDRMMNSPEGQDSFYTDYEDASARDAPVYIDSGFLDAQGDEVRWPDACNDVFNDVFNQSLADQGVDMYSDDDFSQDYTAAEIDEIWESAQAAAEEATGQCARAEGITHSYTDYLTSEHLWPLRGIVGGILVATSGVFLLLSRRSLAGAISRR